MIRCNTVSLWMTDSQLPYSRGEWTGRSSWSIFPSSIDFKKIFISQSGHDIETAIAITISIKNRSGKIGDRFWSGNRSAIFRSKSISVFHFPIDQRLKNRFRTISTDGTQNRIPIFVRKSISDFDRKIDQRFSFRNRIPILKLHSRSWSRSKNQSGSIASRFLSKNRIMVIPVESIHGLRLWVWTFSVHACFSRAKKRLFAISRG